MEDLTECKPKKQLERLFRIAGAGQALAVTFRSR